MCTDNFCKQIGIILTQFDVVVILYWGDAFLCGNFLPQVDKPYYKAWVKLKFYSSFTQAL